MPIKLHIQSSSITRDKERHFQPEKVFNFKRPSLRKFLKDLFLIQKKANREAGSKIPDGMVAKENNVSKSKH